MSGTSDNDYGAPQEPPTAVRKRRKTKENPAVRLQRELLQSVSALQPVDYVDWKRLILTDPEWIGWYQLNSIKYKFQDRLAEALENYKLIAQQKSYLELLDTVNMRSLEMKNGKYERLFDSVAHIKEFFNHNGIDKAEAIKDIFQWADKELSKKNTIVVQGPPNCGKSLIINSIVTGMHNVCRANRFDNTGSQFSLQEGATARVWFMDEVHLQDKFWSTLLILWAGQPVDTDVKNRGHVDIPRVPVIMAFNDHPINNLPINMRSLAKQQLRPRLVTKWKAAEWPYCKNITGQLDPRAWKYLYHEYIDRVDTKTFDSLAGVHGPYPHDLGPGAGDPYHTPPHTSPARFIPPVVPGFSPRKAVSYSCRRTLFPVSSHPENAESSAVRESSLQGMGDVEEGVRESIGGGLQEIANAIGCSPLLHGRGSGSPGVPLPERGNSLLNSPEHAVPRQRGNEEILHGVEDQSEEASQRHETGMGADGDPGQQSCTCPLPDSQCGPGHSCCIYCTHY